MGHHTRKLASDVNVRPLISALESKPHLWREITARQDTPGSPHHDTEAILLRWAKSQSIDAVFNEIPAVDYPALSHLPEARELIDGLLKHVGGTLLGRVILAKLRPGGLITPHVDEGKYADHYERFHLVLRSKPGNEFCVRESDQAGEFVEMREGELWWFNHKREHWAVNGSDEPRTHLIVDAIAPEYRRERDALSA